MDLMDLTPQSDVIVVELMHPVTGSHLLNDDETKMSVTLYAAHSKEYKAAMHKQTDKRLKSMQGGKKASVTSADIEEAGIDLLVDVTKEWNITSGGEKPEFSVDKAKQIYQKVFWIKDQLEEKLSDISLFMEA